MHSRGTDESRAFQLTMARIAGLKFCIAAALAAFAVTRVNAQENDGKTGDSNPSAVKPANPIVAKPGSDAPTSSAPSIAPEQHREVSSSVAARLFDALPKYTPPPPKPAQDEDVDLRDVDKPKNHIIRLPRYVVHQPRPPVLSERAVHTKQGLEALAMERYWTEGYRALNPFTLPLFGTSPEKAAMAMYEEDERLKNMSDLNEQARMVGSEDKAQGQYVKKQVQQTFIRPGDFDWKPIGR